MRARSLHTNLMAARNTQSMQHTDSSHLDAGQPGDHERTPDERSDAEPAHHAEDHQFQYPTVVPVSRPVPAATSQW